MILQKKQLDLDFKTNFKPFDRILVAVDEDDSKSSLAAFQYALALAKPNLAALGIVSVLELEDLNVFETFSPEKRNQLRENLTVDLERYVKKAQENGIYDVRSFVQEGKPAATIISEIIPEFKPDVLLCGSKTKPVSNAKKIFIGSQASYLAQNAPCSVMVIRS
ncbi:MAG: universal stress protein [Liquorilactobacillus nagelii]|jgi:nucleotide-binding universal stress UspA family protein|uniref:Universal stress protein UspA n=1 Tax=Liquorilactobacillus nagelii TaxID=82688 RepID=A0A3S6QU37_9LACO|nr:universal stress protein [Liquorilactobacillus nagelii]AUJ31642.1 universal stress protein UspA [Liquorilactobacillus nagelii]MCC7615995.1 universal stress protein UspA [Liquorilactobacillus nagelii]MCP9314302.1 universal stress protein [Liquorilactobacillus nagelii]ULQ49974.1 universal stress protein [Liquorilactobacillus nagelii]